MKRKIVVIVALAAVCMLCVSFAACGEEYSGGYMSCLKSDAKLGEIVMLGAHDAGTWGRATRHAPSTAISARCWTPGSDISTAA